MRLFKDLQPFRQMYVCPQAALKAVLALPPQDLHSCRLHRGRAAPWRMLRGLPVPGGELWMNRAASPLLSLLCCPHGEEEEQSSHSCHQHSPLLGHFAHPTEGRITEGASRAARGFIRGFAPNRRRAGLRGGRVCVEEASRALPVQMGGRSHGRRTKGSIIGVTGYLPVQARTLGH